jgi:homoserine trans-succinylase
MKALPYFKFEPDTNTMCMLAAIEVIDQQSSNTSILEKNNRKSMVLESGEYESTFSRSIVEDVAAGTKYCENNHPHGNHERSPKSIWRSKIKTRRTIPAKKINLSATLMLERRSYRRTKG